MGYRWILVYFFIISLDHTPPIEHMKLIGIEELKGFRKSWIYYFWVLYSYYASSVIAYKGIHMKKWYSDNNIFVFYTSYPQKKFSWIFALYPDGREFYRLCRYVHNVADQTIKKRKEELVCTNLMHYCKHC